MGGTENSSDLDLGRRPELESDEFSVPPIVVIEKISLLCLKPLNRCGSFWEPDPTLRGRRLAVKMQNLEQVHFGT